MADEAHRPLRADARRNRDKILTTAARLFTAEGLNAQMDRIAKEAGVGSATLYRNFPTREALVEAVYRNEVAQLCDSVSPLLAEKAPDEALRAWTRLFLDYVTTKHGMIDALRAIAATGGNPYGHSREMILASVTTLMDACVAAGTIGPTSPGRHQRRAGGHRPDVGGRGAPAAGGAPARPHAGRPEGPRVTTPPASPREAGRFTPGPVGSRPGGHRRLVDASGHPGEKGPDVRRGRVSASARGRSKLLRASVTRERKTGSEAATTSPALRLANQWPVRQ